jgi:Tfp pilus assembly protein PilN
MRRTSLRAGFGVVLLALVLLVSLGVFVIWQQGVRQQLDALREERFRFSLAHVKTSLEASLLLGMTAHDLPGAQALIGQVRSRQPDILSIDVFDPQGQVVFSTDPGAVGLQVPHTWSGPCLKQGGNPWSTHADDADLQCVGLVNAFDQPAGGVLLRHRLPSRNNPGLALLDVGLGWLAALLAVLAGGWVLAGSVVRPLERRAQHLRTQLALATALPDKPLAEADAHFGPAKQALQALVTQHTRLRDTDAEAERLDRMEAQ